MILRRFRINLIFKLAGEAAARLSSLIFYAVGARLLGVEDFGLFSLSFSYAFILVVFLEMGMNSILTREIAREKKNAGKILGGVLPVKLLMAPLAFFVVHPLVVALGYEPRVVLLCDLMCVAALGTGFWELISAVMSGVERMDAEAGFKTFWKLAALGFAVAGFWISPNAEGFILGMGIGQWIAVVAAFAWFSWKVEKIELSWDPALFGKIFRLSFPVFASWIFIYLYDNQDIYLLSWMKFSNQEIGFFSGSAKLIDALRPLPVLLIGAVFPILAEASQKDRPLTVKIVRPVVSYTILMLFPALLVLSALSPFVVKILFGGTFAPASPVFSIAVWGFFGIFLNHILVNTLVTLDGQKFFFYGAVAAAAVNAVSCYLLFQRMGIVGGAWALVISEAVWIGLNALLVVRLLHADGLSWSATFLKPFSLVALGGAAYGLGWKFFGQGAGLAAGLVIFFGAVFATGSIDWALLKRMRKA